MESFRNLDPFDPELERIEDYKERFDFYCVAHGVAEERKKALFLTGMGQKMYTRLKIWVSPTPLHDLSLDEIVAKLKARTVPETIEIAERFRFFKRQQGADEGLTDYMSGLRALAKTCNFGNYLETALRDQFVCGLKDVQIQRELLCTRDLTVSQAFEKGRSMEAVLKETKTFHQEEERSVQQESKGPDNGGPGGTYKLSKSPQSACYRCGGMGHPADSCFFRKKRCNSCGKIGHKAKVCRSSQGSRKKGDKGKSSKMHLLEADSHSPDSCSSGEDEEDRDMEIHKLAGSKNHYKKLITRLEVEGENIDFEVDTGAELSTIPWQVFRRHLSKIPVQPSSVILRQYDGSVLPIKGEITVGVVSEQQREIGQFVIVKNADSQLPLLGRDWLYKLRLNWPRMLTPPDVGDPRVHTLLTAGWINEFPEVMGNGLGRLKGIMASIELKEGAHPKFCKHRPIPFALRAQVEEAIRQQVEDGELKPVEQSEWAAPIVVIRKNDGSIRVCADFKVTINPYLCQKTFPLPTADEVFSTLAGGESFTKLDLACAFKQMEVAKESRHFLTINTHLGLFQFQRLPFGVATAPAMWQRAMSIVLQGCKRVVYYMDDILVTGSSRMEHEANLRHVFQRLQQYGLKINLGKCRFFQKSVDFLGHRVTPEGVQPMDERVKGIMAASTPQNRAELKSFLGLISYNSKFIPSLSTVLHPLYKLLQKEIKWRWSKDQESSFQSAKELVSKATLLVHYDPTKPVKVYCDASSVGVGACLMHVEKGVERPVMYASRSLSQAETKYAQIEREALAIIFAVKKFHQYLYGRQFVLVTDHRPLCKILGHDQAIPPLAAARMQHWALILSAYRYSIQYIAGEKNSCADCLSRLPVKQQDAGAAESSGDIFALDWLSIPVTAKDVANATRKDKILAVVLQWVQHGNWPSQSNEATDPYFRRRFELTCQNGCILWGQRVVIPNSLREQLLKELHEGHIGIVRMKSLARSYIWWPKLDADIARLAARCVECGATASMPQAFSYHPWQHPRAPWDRVHADFGEWRGTHFLVVVDAYSKWPEVRRMRSTTTQHTIEVLLDIFATHGLPRVLVTDNGPQFTSIEFSNFLSSNCIAHRTSAPYHPATNGLAENMVKNVKQWLKKEDKGSSFHASITEFLRTYRVVPHTGTGKSPAEIIFGRTLRTRISMVLPNMTGSEEACSFAPARTTFHVGDTVWIRDFRSTSGNKWCKGTIKEILGAVTYMVGLPEGYQRKAHLDHLRSRSIEVEDSSGSFVAGRPLSRPLPTGLPFNSVGDMCGQQQPESTVPLPYRLDNEESPMCQLGCVTGYQVIRVIRIFAKTYPFE